MGSGCKSTKRLNCKALLPRFAAQQAHAADAAARQQDRWHFRISFCAYTCTILQGGAADGQGVGPQARMHRRRECALEEAFQSSPQIANATTDSPISSIRKHMI